MSDTCDTPAPEAATVIILAGGTSARMGGQHKGLLPWAGKTLLGHLVVEGQAAARQVIVVSGEEVAVPPGATRVADVFAGCGPLGGLHAGLSAAHFERCVALGCDMPFARAAVMRLVLELAGGHDAAVPRASDGLHPLLASYSRNCLAAIEEQLRAGNRRMRSFFERGRVRWVSEAELRQADPDLLSLFNINTWQDYERALRLAANRPAAE